MHEASRRVRSEQFKRYIKCAFPIFFVQREAPARAGRNISQIQHKLTQSGISEFSLRPSTTPLLIRANLSAARSVKSLVIVRDFKRATDFVFERLIYKPFPIFCIKMS